MGLAIPQGLTLWISVAIAVAVAALANTIATKWASTPEWINPYLWPMLLLSPLVFITFGRVTAQTGLASGSATVDSLLTVTTVVIGLIYLQEWRKMSVDHYLGIVLVLIGVYLIRKPMATAVQF